jgi:uncharacterized membrane protein
MTTYLLVKILHILSSTLLFGTGLGIAFFIYRSRFSSSIDERHYAIRNAVLADYIFTLPAVIIQPLTGIWLIQRAGFDWLDLWLVATYILYFVAGICWIPVVWIQIQLKQMLANSIRHNSDFPERYNRLFRVWTLLGIPAFLSIVAIFFLMVAKPV